MKAIALTIALSIAAVSAMAETEVGIAKDMPSVTVHTRNGPVEIRRIQDCPLHQSTLKPMCLCEGQCCQHERILT